MITNLWMAQVRGAWVWTTEDAELSGVSAAANADQRVVPAATARRSPFATFGSGEISSKIKELNWSPTDAVAV